MSILSIIYSVPPFEIKNKGLFGNLLLGIDMIFTSMYAGYVISANSLIPNIEFLITLSLFTVSFILIDITKDFKDVSGDSVHGKKTPVIKYSKNLLISFIIIGTFMLFFTTILFNIYYFQNMTFLLISFIIFILMITIDMMLFKRTTAKFGESAWGYTRILFLILIINMLFFSISTFT